jgi:O-acetylhomoserine/O-acetylserine sulfhydrylase-like pyridoxal-dependent enzyme
VAEFLETHPRVAWVAYAGLPASPTTRWSGNTSRTHRQLNQEQRQSADAGDDVIRLSIGLESADDPIANLDRTLDQT